VLARPDSLQVWFPDTGRRLGSTCDAAVRETLRMVLTLRWDQPAGGRLAQFEASSFVALNNEGDVVGRISCQATETATALLSARLGGPEVQVLRDSISLFALQTADANLSTPEGLDSFLASGVMEIALDSYAIDGIPTIADPKRCDRQLRIDRDLWCAAASASDTTASLTIGGRAAAPTSVPLCAGCDLPDVRLRCSHLMHPSVTATRVFGGGHERSLGWALCDRGHQDLVTAAPRKCVPDVGHPCWERQVGTPAMVIPESLDPLALTDALDHFDDVWRLAFGVPILRLPSGTDAALLSQPASTRAELVDRVRALAEVLGRLSVSDDLLPADVPDEHRRGSLNRVESALRGRSASTAIPPITDAVAQLRRILRLDSAYSHSTGELPSLWPQFGMSNPPRQWAEAWRAVQHTAITALRTLTTRTRSFLT